MPKVLVVEDFDYFFKMINRELNGKVEMLRAKTLEEGDNLFQSNPDVDLIIMGACVPGDEPNTMPLIRKIVDSGYQWPIIASSGIPPFTKKLICAGATHEIGKEGAAKLALKLLNLI